MKSNSKIRKRRDFVRATESGLYFRADCFVVQAAFSGLEGWRVGFTASKRVGCAVIRNRCKRRMRAIADLLLPEFGIAGVDYVFIARPRIECGVDSIGWSVLLEKAIKAINVLNGKIRRIGLHVRKSEICADSCEFK